MAFLQFSDKLYVRAIDTNEDSRMGSFTTTRDTELQHLVLTMYKQGTEGGSETFRINIYPDNTQSTAVYQSDVATLASVSPGTNELFTVRFDFSRSHINKNLTYFPSIEMANYTRNADTFYMAWVLDFPSEINTNNELQRRGARMGIVGFRDRT